MLTIMKLPLYWRAAGFAAMVGAFALSISWLHTGYQLLSGQIAVAALAVLLGGYHGIVAIKMLGWYHERSQLNRNLDEAPRFPTWVPAELTPMSAAVRYVTSWHQNHRQNDIAPVVTIGYDFDAKKRVDYLPWHRCCQKQLPLPLLGLWWLGVDAAPCILAETLRALGHTQGAIALLFFSALVAVWVHFRKFPALINVERTDRTALRVTIVTSDLWGRTKQEIHRIDGSTAVLVVFGSEIRVLLTKYSGEVVSFNMTSLMPPLWLRELALSRSGGRVPGAVAVA